jgi:hypothetical protein
VFENGGGRRTHPNQLTSIHFGSWGLCKLGLDDTFVVGVITRAKELGLPDEAPKIDMWLTSLQSWLGLGRAKIGHSEARLAFASARAGWPSPGGGWLDATRGREVTTTRPALTL